VSDDGSTPYALWLLRLILAAVLLAHLEVNFGGLDAAYAAHWLGIPANVSWSGTLLELFVAVALIVGILPRIAAAVGIGELLIVIAAVRGTAVFAQFDWTKAAVWISALLLLALAGDGAFALIPTSSARKCA
jgi:putative oxidoreductase